MKAKNITIFKVTYYENHRVCPVTYRNLDYEIHDGVLELYNIEGYPDDYIRCYALNSISNFIINFDEDED